MDEVDKTQDTGGALRRLRAEPAAARREIDYGLISQGSDKNLVAALG